VVALVALGVVVGLVLRGRATETRAEPLTHLLHALALVFMLVVIGASGLLVHDVAEVIGPSTVPAVESGPEYPPCDSVSTGVSTATTTTLPIPCIQYPDSSGQSSGDLGSYQSGEATIFAGGGSIIGDDQFVDFGTYSNNASISDGVGAGLFLLMAGIGFWLTWPRARRLSGTGTDADIRLASRYNYLVVGLAALSLLVVVPLATYNIFRAIAPGVTGAYGHADGVRTFASLAVVAGLTALALVHHLRIARPPVGGGRGEEPANPVG
jgi:hypothetical protein